MKHRIIFAIIILTIQICKGQSDIYHPFVRVGAEWSELFGNIGIEPIDTFYYTQTWHSGGDSIVDGKSYIKYMIGFGVYTLILDDSSNKKVYTLWDDGVHHVDTLLYDFGLGVGASVSHSTEFLDYPDAHIERIDSILLGANYRKRFQIDYTYSSGGEIIEDSAYWIEGIGSTNGFMKGPHADYFEYPNYRKLICYSEYENLIYSNMEDWYTCDSILIPQPIVIAEVKNEPHFEIYPNPASDYILIRCDNCFIQDRLSIELIGIGGNIIFDMVQESNYISLQGIPAGLYIIRVTNNINLFSQKIIIN